MCIVNSLVVQGSEHVSVESVKPHYAFLLETVFINFIKRVSWKTGEGSLPVNLFLSLMADLQEEDLKKA